ITLVSKSQNAMDLAVTELLQHFKLCDLGPTNVLLLIQIKQDLQEHKILLSQ
ncbi:hypothetical protein P691DRAFT_623909, partial [Macrolepiota fuliginosa MF-IS2]